MSRWIETGPGDTPTPAGSGDIRAPAVAGSFYPSARDRLETTVREQCARPRGCGARGAFGDAAHRPAGPACRPRVLRRGGRRGVVRARRAPGTPPPVVVLLGTNHGAGWLDGRGRLALGRLAHPPGRRVPVDGDVSAAVVSLGRRSSWIPRPHELEHSIEVQLPLLQVVAPRATIVPLSVSCRGPWRWRLARASAGCSPSAEPRAFPWSWPLARTWPTTHPPR